MPTYKIRGIDVDFPFEAYGCQIVYMEKVIEALQNKCNALLESPTGTGKTLCLLCATLAYRKSLGAFSTGRVPSKGNGVDPTQFEDKGGNLPTIVYTSRTHSQLRQVIQELKRSVYRPKMTVLGSREQLCIHEEVSQLHGRTQTNACHFVSKKRKKNRCSHYPRVSGFLNANPNIGDEPVDIEELVNIGKSCGPCPYYMSRELHKVADILFAPYNYLIEHGHRKSLSVDWNNSILIFDEAHNLESLCADAASFDLPSGLLSACISEANTCINRSVSRRDKENDKSCSPDDYAILKALLLKLEKRIAEVPIESKEFGFTKPGPYIYDLLADLNITKKTSGKLIGIIDEAILLLEEAENEKTGAISEKRKGNGCRLETMADIFRLIFEGDDDARYYRVHVQEVERKAAAYKGKASRTLSWWCFNPGIAMRKFSGLHVGSIILTSGTLSPMDSFAQELQLEFPVQLENPHVICPSQIWAGVVPVGPSGCSLNSSFRNRDSVEYKQDLGNAIVNFSRIVPDGLLIFFPSYYLLDECIGFWKNPIPSSSTYSSSIWERICRYKQPVVEPRESSLFLQSIEDYMSKLKGTSSSGAVFFAVCRGKVSEGLDFADHAGRAVVVTGMPFATRIDPKVRLKREYLDGQAQSCKEARQALLGEEWYNQQASRAVNQAVGRVIRHRHDYGAIIFCDERFAHPNRRSQVSLWIRPHIECYSRFGDVVFSLTRFFRDGGNRAPKNLDAQIGDIGNLKAVKSEKSLDKLHLEKFIIPLTAPANKSNSESLSSLLGVKREKSSTQLLEVVPANRSSLTPYNPVLNGALKCSSDLFGNRKCLLKKKLLPPNATQCQNEDVIDLTSDESSDKKPGRDAIASCCGKKRKLVEVESDVTVATEIRQECISVVKRTQYNCSNDDPVKPEMLLLPISGSSTQTALAKGTICDCIVQNRAVEFQDQKNKGSKSRLVPCQEEETKGSAFLAQVREILGSGEYKEFVEFMKALKSKAMKIGHVLQSIARLFSGPERLPLQQRFKEYIPANYHGLYDKYLEQNGKKS